MDIKVYHTLHKDAVKIRKEVFMEEQGFHDEFDETDENAVHLVLYIDQIPAATCRFFPEQTQGEYTLAAVAEEDDAKLTVIASESMINSQITEYFSNLDNSRLFLNLVMNNFDDVENLSIKAKSLSVELNTVRHAGSISTALIFGVPAVVLIGGFVIWMKRRKA